MFGNSLSKFKTKRYKKTLILKLLKPLYNTTISVLGLKL
jgi:hypothetical protein